MSEGVAQTSASTREILLALKLLVIWITSALKAWFVLVPLAWVVLAWIGGIVDATTLIVMHPFQESKCVIAIQSVDQGLHELSVLGPFKGAKVGRSSQHKTHELAIAEV